MPLPAAFRLTAVLLVSLALAACDGVRGEPEIRFERVQLRPGDGEFKAGLPPFPVSLTPEGVVIEGYYLASGGDDWVRGRVRRVGRLVEVEVSNRIPRHPFFELPTLVHG